MIMPYFFSLQNVYFCNIKNKIFTYVNIFVQNTVDYSIINNKLFKNW